LLSTNIKDKLLKLVKCHNSQNNLEIAGMAETIPAIVARQPYVLYGELDMLLKCLETHSKS